jgi:hypothetical protein
MYKQMIEKSRLTVNTQESFTTNTEPNHPAERFENQEERTLNWGELNAKEQFVILLHMIVILKGS